MNERIKELAIQAGGGPSKWYTDPNVLQEFAELIVRECAEIASCNGHVSGFALGDLIKEHFGVEE